MEQVLTRGTECAYTVVGVRLPYVSLCVKRMGRRTFLYVGLHTMSWNCDYRMLNQSSVQSYDIRCNFPSHSMPARMIVRENVR